MAEPRQRNCSSGLDGGSPAGEPSAGGRVQRLAPNQLRLWTFEQLNPASGVYNIPGGISIRGNLDRHALERSFTALVSRHEAFRTVLGQRSGMPFLRVIPPFPVELPLVDLKQECRGRTFEAVLKQEAKRPLELLDGPLFRVVLWRVSATRHILQLTMHHIVSDGWSMGLVVRELAALYEATTQGEPAELPSIRVSYGDLAAAKNDGLAGDEFRGDLEFWRTQLAGAPPVLDLPFDRPRPRTPSHSGGVVRVRPPEPTVSGLAALSRRESVSPFVTIFAAWQVLLCRLSGQWEIVSGFLSANRSPRTAGVVGYLVDLLPLRSAISSDSGFREIQRATAASMAEALRHGRVPFEGIVGTLDQERDSSHHPTIQVVAVQASAEEVALPRSGAHFSYVLLDESKAKFDLSLYVCLRRDECDITIEYSADLFDRDTAKRIASNFSVLLNGIVADPDLAVARLPLLTEGERRKILYTWNDTSKDYGRHTLHALFQSQVRRAPSAVAVREADSTRLLTYRKLDDLATGLANRLRDSGVSTGDRVGVHAERSIELVVAVLAALKSGAAYVPLDPEHPIARNLQVISDAELSVCLAQPGLESSLSRAGVRVVRLAEEHEEYSRAAAGGAGGDTDASPGAATGDAAYVMYTSGSTGAPKGVVNTHGGICNRLLWMQERFGLRASDRLLQKTPISFDVSALELFWPLMAGAQLVMARPGGHRDHEYLVRTIAEQQITTVHFVPSMLRFFVDAEGVEHCNGVLRRILCSGEVLSRDLQQRVLSTLDASLHNFYGPTEAAVDVTWWDCHHDDEGGPVPIGRPIANTEIYILDELRQPVPVGVAGEIHIGGLNVAAGYWKRPQLTRRAFVGDHLGKKRRGGVLFRSGDLGRFRKDGAIDFLGRMDRQVKIRGNRVELGEVEAALKGHAGVRDAVVVESAGSLVGVLIASSNPPAASELRVFLRSSVPDFMVPSRILFVDALPQTTSGKLDVLEVARLAAAQEEPRGSLRKPDSAESQVLADVWCSVLGVTGVGLDDNFFALGGDSLRMLEVVEAARRRGVSLASGDILRNPTLEELARVATRQRPATDESTSGAHALVSHEDRRRLPDGVEDAYPLSRLQAGLVYHSQTNGQYAVYVTSHCVQGHLDVSALERVVADTVDRHPLLRTSFEVKGFSEPLQLVHRTADLALDVVDWTHLGNEAQDRALAEWVAEQRTRRFSWDQAPLFRFFVHKRSDSTFQFSVVEPFLDGWSVAILCVEILSGYARVAADAYVARGRLHDACRAHVELERKALASTGQREFWNRKLAGVERMMLPSWPGPDPRTGTRPRFVRHTVSIPATVTERLRQLSAELSLPLKSVALAAHLRAMSVLCGRKHVVTGFMTNGRPESAGGTQAVGLFLNVVPLVARITGSWEDLIRAAAELETEMIEFRRYPLDQIQRDNGGVFFDSVFNYIHFRAYRQLDEEPPIRILSTRATDQTYFALTAQFTLDWRTSLLRLDLDFNGGDFPQDQIASVAAVYSRVLDRMSRAPRDKCTDFGPAPLTERDQTVCEGDAASPPSAEECFSASFERQVEATGTATAVADADRRLTYDQLNARANRLAHGLRAIGVGPDVIVGLLADRSVDFLAAILGIHKAGGAYLSFDPAWPRRRIGQVLAHSRTSLVLYEKRFLSLVQDATEDGASDSATWLALENLFEESEETRNPLQVATAGNLAYVLYTSGSSGAPKGAMIEHGGMLNHIRAKVDDLDLEAGTVVAQTASQCFDISVWQFLAPICVGGRVEVASGDVAGDPVALHHFLRERSVNVFETVPTMLRSMLDASLGTGLESLRWLLVTGEASPVDLYGRWAGRYPSVRVMNAYGPTECSDDVTHHVVADAPPPGVSTVPIGRPIRNTSIFIVDEDFNPVPPGTPGELVIEGAGVGRGYLHDEDQTSRAFCRAPASLPSAKGRRVYRTGDRGRRLCDGSIEFLGRLDRQIKLRGFRLEASEIETALREDSAVRDAFVTVKRLTGGDSLVAFVVPRSEDDGSGLDIAGLRQRLRRGLPQYAVPGTFVMLQRLPLNDNGKIDVGALPDAGTAGPTRSAYVTPGTELEIALAGIWASAFGVDRVGACDDFYELGGHSLMAMRLVARISQELGYDVSTGQILACPTISALAASLEAKAGVHFRVPEGGIEEESSAKLEFLTSARGPLDALIREGRISPVDSAALGYIAVSALRRAGLRREEVVNGVFAGKPQARCVYHTPVGRICHITLPIVGDELYSDRPRLLDVVDEAVEMAGGIGARSVTLTGLIPSATDYGEMVEESPAGAAAPSVGTGHATTSAAVVMTMERILAQTERNIVGESVGFIGVGSVGLSSLFLMLDVLPHPREIHLCDLYEKRDRLTEIGRRLKRESRYAGPVHLHSTRGTVPRAFYAATLMVGATNAANVLDVASLKAGTLLVDDSAPHCFDVTVATRRLLEQSDILFTEGGVLRLDAPIAELRHTPARRPADNIFDSMTSYRASDRDIMGCVFSSLLPSVFDDMKTEKGIVTVGQSRQHYRRLRRLKIEGALPSCLGTAIPGSAVQAFRRRFGGSRASGL